MFVEVLCVQALVVTTIDTMIAELIPHVDNLMLVLYFSFNAFAEVLAMRTHTLIDPSLSVLFATVPQVMVFSK